MRFQTPLIGLRSGLFAGHLSNLISSSWNWAMVIRALWQGALSIYIIVGVVPNS